MRLSCGFSLRSASPKYVHSINGVFCKGLKKMSEEKQSINSDGYTRIASRTLINQMLLMNHLLTIEMELLTALHLNIGNTRININSHL